MRSHVAALCPAGAHRSNTVYSLHFKAFHLLSPDAPFRFWRIVQLSEKQLPANPAVGRLKHMVEEVKRTVPVVADLRSGTLTSRHWESLDSVLGMDIRKGESVTFKQMMEVRVSSQHSHYIFTRDT